MGTNLPKRRAVQGVVQRLVGLSWFKSVKSVVSFPCSTGLEVTSTITACIVGTPQQAGAAGIEVQWSCWVAGKWLRVYSSNVLLAGTFFWMFKPIDPEMLHFRCMY